MTEARPADLLYGHLGEPKYDSETQQWHFSRVPGINGPIKSVGQSILSIEGSREDVGDFRQGAVERTRSIRDLSRLYPELLPSTPLLPELAQVSEAVETVTSSHDPLTSELLALGRAEVENYRRVVPIAAIAAGAGGELVRLVVLNKEQLGWNGDKTSGLQVRTASEGEQAWWKGDGSPIQQLVFSEAAEGEANDWLAVRYHGAISLLRPILRDRYIKPKSDRSEALRLPPSRLDANHILTIPMEKGNGVPYADITFSPWSSQLLATIDLLGHWIIWSIDAKYKARGLWRAGQKSSGESRPATEDDETSSTEIHDGWCRALWTGDSDTVLFAFRRSLRISNMNSDLEMFMIPDLALTQSNDWILDVKRSHSNASHVFVLTSSRIFWLRIVTVNESRSLKNLAASGHVLLSWVHFRDPADTSLQLTLVCDKDDPGVEDQTTFAFLYSRLTDLVTVYTFKFSPTENRALSASDPYILQLPETGYVSTGNRKVITQSGRRLANIMLQPLEYGSLYGHPLTEITKRYMDNHVIFYQLNILYDDLALLESLHARSVWSTGFDIHAPGVRTRQKSVKTSTKVSGLDFIVPDNIDLHVSSENIPELDLLKMSKGDASPPVSVEKEDPYTLNMEWLRQEIQGSTVEQFENEKDEAPARTSFEEALEVIQTSIEEKLSKERQGIDSLLDLEDTEMSLTDTDIAAASMRRFLDQNIYPSHDSMEQDGTENPSISNVSVLLTPSLQAMLGFEKGLEIPQVYNNLVQSFITPLDPQVPGRARIAIHKTLQEIAAQLCLASHGVRLNPQPTPDEEGLNIPEPTAPESSFTLPMRRKASLSNPATFPKPTPQTSSRPSSPPPQSSSQPSPSTPSSPFPLPPPTPPSHSPSLLNTLTSLPPQPRIPPSLSTILSHWTPATDPSTYDYLTSSSLFQPSTSDHLSQERKPHRQKEKKRRREPALGPSSGPLPKRMGGSERERGGGSSSVGAGRVMVTEGLGTASQPVAGVYGGRRGRVVGKGKGKKRVAGFK